jgi:hypothetical protein
MPHHAEWTRSTKANNSILVNDSGQTIRNAKANGRIAAFEDRPGLTYLRGDAAPAYMGNLTRFDRHVLFLRPGLILILDDLEAPEPATYQWMLHAFEEMELSDAQVISRREDTTLNVHLSSPSGLALNQTDQFDTPYNSGIPEQFYKDMPNHYHVTAETNTKTKATRIGAALSVYNQNETFETTILEHEGWFGARATGGFGTVEGWVQLLDNAPGPNDFGEIVTSGNTKACGRDRDGEIFVV